MNEPEFLFNILTFVTKFYKTVESNLIKFANINVE